MRDRIMIEKRRQRYAVTMLEKLLARQEQLLAQEYSRLEREHIRETIRFLYRLRNQFEGALKMTITVTLNTTEPPKWNNEEVAELLQAIQGLVQPVLSMADDDEYDCDSYLWGAVVAIDKRITEAFDAVKQAAADHGSARVFLQALFADRQLIPHAEVLKLADAAGHGLTALLKARADLRIALIGKGKDATWESRR